MFRDTCATLLQSHWRRNVGLQKSKDMREYWQRMEQWTLEQEYNQTPQGQAHLVKLKILNKSLSNNKKAMKKKLILKRAKTSNPAHTDDAQIARVKPSTTAVVRASLASRKVFAKAAFRRTFARKKASNGQGSVKKKQLAKLKLKPKHARRNKKQWRMEAEIFRDDELEVGDVVLVKWNKGRVGWPAMVVGIHYNYFVSQFTGEMVGHKFRTFDVLYQEDRLMGYRVPLELITEVLAWKDEAHKNRDRKEHELYIATKKYKTAAKTKDKKQAKQAKALMERSERAFQSAVQSVDAGEHKLKEQFEQERIGWEAPDVRLM